MMTCQLSKWERALDSFDSAGGHLIGAFGVLLFGVLMEKIGIAYGHEIQVMGATGMALALKSDSKSNQARKERLTEDTATIKIETAAKPPDGGKIVP